MNHSLRVPQTTAAHLSTHRRSLQKSSCILSAIFLLILVPILHAATPFGVVGDWDWVDLIKGVGSWNTVGNATSVPQDDRGFPLSDFGVTIIDSRKNMPYRGPDPIGINPDVSGVYHLTFTGIANIAANTEVSGGVRILSQKFNPATGTTLASIYFRPGFGLLQLTFTNTQRTPSSPIGSGLTNIRFIQPGYTADTTQVFTRATLAAYNMGFAAIRFLGPDAANNYNTFYGPNGSDINTARWADRVQVTDAYQNALDSRNTGGKVSQGTAWEYMIEIANKTHHDMWINVPISADEDYVRQLATLIRDGNEFTAGLSKDLHVYVELSNEVWNFGFQQSIYNQIQANNEGITIDQRYIEHSVQNAQIFQNIFNEAGKTQGRVRPVAFWQYTQQLTFFNAINWWEQHYGDHVNKYIYGIGEAPYYNAPDISTVQAVFDSQYTNSDATRRDFIGWQAVASYFGIKEAGYEAGPSLFIEAPAYAIRDARMIPSINHHFLDNWYAVGGDLVEYFTIRGAVSKFGDYLLLEDFDHRDTPTYEAARQVLAAPQPELTAGQLLPWAINQKVVMDPSQVVNYPFGSDPVPGSGITVSQGGNYVYLLRSTGDGTFTIRFTAQASSGTAPLNVFVDDQQIGTVNFGTGVSTSTALTFEAGSGFHGLSLVAAGSGNVIFPASIGGISITRQTGSGVAKPPSAPANLTIVSGDGKASLLWASTASASAYSVQRSTNSGGPYTQVGIAHTNSYTDTAVTNGTTYYYAIRAINQAGKGGLSPQVPVYPGPAAVPSAPANLTAQSGGGDFNVFFGTGIALLSWNPSANASGYNIYSSSDGINYNQIGGPQVGTTFPDRSINNGGTYYYQVTAVNSHGESSRSSTATASPVLAVRQPPVLSVEVRSGYNFLHWIADPLSNPQFGTAFNVKRSTRPEGPFTTIIQINSDNAYDYTATPGKDYYYIVTATNSAGESMPSNEVDSVSEKAHTPQNGGGSTTPYPVPQS